MDVDSEPRSRSPRSCPNGSAAGSLSVPSGTYRRSSLSESDRVSRLKVEIAARERDDLEIIKKDVCEWLARTLEIEVSPGSFMDTLDTGVVLCRLARLIQEKAKSSKEAGDKVAVSVPMETIRCQVNAKKGTFFARDNTANFIKWCKRLGVNEEVIFESNGLVQQEDEKRVILCLIDVSRYAHKLKIKPPELVRLENEIEMQELDHDSNYQDCVFPNPPILQNFTDKDSSTSSLSQKSSTSELLDDQKDDQETLQIEPSEHQDIDAINSANDSEPKTQSVQQELAKQEGIKLLQEKSVDNEETAEKQQTDLNMPKLEEKQIAEGKAVDSGNSEIQKVDLLHKQQHTQPHDENAIDLTTSHSLTKPPKSDEIRSESPNLKEKGVTRKPPKHSPHRSPRRSPRHRSQEPEQPTQPKQQLQPKKEEPPPQEEKTDELVSGGGLLFSNYMYNHAYT